jgi:type II secretory pathway component PulF
MCYYGPHAFRNIGQHQARLQFIIVPGARSEEFFRQLSQLLRHGQPAMDVLNALGTQYDTRFVGPPLGAVEHDML